MEQLKIFAVTISLCSLLLQGCKAQPSMQGQTLSFITSIALPGVGGRIDHLTYDRISQRIFVAALGNNSIEVIDLKTNKVTHSIQHLSEPQGIAFIPENNTILVANGNNGVCDIFNAGNFQKITSIQLPGDADNVRYDSVDKKIYVGYGEGGIAVIDAITFKQIGDIKMERHPESFQLDIAAKKIFVNVPGKQQVEIIDFEAKKVTDRWKLTEAKSNFPMSLDVINHRLYIGCRHPAKLLILDTNTGKLVNSVDTDSDTDDIFYNAKSKSIYLSCGGGFIDIIKQVNPDTYQLTEKIASHSGARTSLFIPQLNRFIVASPKDFRNDAALLVYAIKN